jgi:hypothetical protein
MVVTPNQVSYGEWRAGLVMVRSIATKRNVSALRLIVASATIVAKMSRFHEIGIVAVIRLTAHANLALSSLL